MKRQLSGTVVAMIVVGVLLLLLAIGWNATRPPVIPTPAAGSGGSAVGMFDPKTGKPRGGTISPWPGHTVPPSMAPGAPTPPPPLKSDKPPVGMFDPKTGRPRGATQNPNVPKTP